MPTANQAPSFEELLQSEQDLNFNKENQYDKALNYQNFTYTTEALLPKLITETMLWQQIAFVAGILNSVAFFVFLYAIIRIFQIRTQEYKNFAKEPPSYAAKVLLGDTAVKNVNTKEQNYGRRWQHIEAYLNKGTTADWRMAIIEADIMLDELLTSWGYVGGSVGDKLKQINADKLRSIEDAWQAHKLRNKIAHEGLNAKITEREVRSAMHKYRNVFKEVGILD